MDCKHAYLKDGIHYILCRKEEEPDVTPRKDRHKLYHSMCLYQAFCRNEGCYRLKPEYIQCKKLQESAGEYAREAKGENAPKKKAPQNAK